MFQPLQGKEILITRNADQSNSFADLIRNQGGIPVEIPLLEINCISCNDRFLNQITEYEWIFFTSANGVHCFFKAINNRTSSLRLSDFENVKFAVVGDKTEKSLLDYGFSANFIPSVYNGEVMAAEFIQQFRIDGSLLIVKGNRSRAVLQKAFTTENILFDEIVTYETKSNHASKSILRSYFNEKLPDFITFTSPSSVEAFMDAELQKSFISMAHKVPCVCIGTTTEQRARELGFTHTLIPNQFNIDGMVERIRDYISEKG